MLAEMTGDFPLLYKVFVSERDKYLARSLRLSAMPIAIHNHEGGMHDWATCVFCCKIVQNVTKEQSLSVETNSEQKMMIIV